MKKAIAVLIACLLAILSMQPAFSEPRTLDISAMSLAEIQSLIDELEIRKQEITYIDETTRNNLEANAKSIYEEAFGSVTWSKTKQVKRDCEYFQVYLKNATITYNGTKYQIDDIYVGYWWDLNKYYPAFVIDSRGPTFQNAEYIGHIARFIPDELAQQLDIEHPTEATAEQDEEIIWSPSVDSIKLQFGELLDVVDNYIDNVLVIKAKIKGSYSTEATINQNYYNMYYLIMDYDVLDYKEIQYWAVADMTSGDESKVISFTVPKYVMELIRNKGVVANKLGDYVTDLWLHPSLK